MMLQTGYVPVPVGDEQVELFVLMNEDLALAMVGWLRFLKTQPDGVEHQHARRVILRLARKFENTQLQQLIDVTPTTPSWDAFVYALEAEIERRVLPVAWPPVDLAVVGQLTAETN